MTDTHVIFVPKDGVPHTLAAGSALVASIESSANDLILVYYEGNLYNAVNMRDYPSRVMNAADRQATRYPTSAVQGFKPEELIEVGRYDYHAKRITSLTNAAHLRAWLPDEAGWVDQTIATQAQTMEARLRRLIDEGLTFSTVTEVFAACRTPRELAYVQAAQGNDQLSDGALEVDDGAIVSEGGDDGAYVSAWLWVERAAAGLEEDDEEEAA